MLMLADLLVRSGECRNVLVVGGENRLTGATRDGAVKRGLLGCLRSPATSRAPRGRVRLRLGRLCRGVRPRGTKRRMLPPQRRAYRLHRNRWQRRANLGPLWGVDERTRRRAGRRTVRRHHR